MRLLQHERHLLSTVFPLGVAGAWKMPPREEAARGRQSHELRKAPSLVADRPKEIDLQTCDHAAPGDRRRALRCDLPPPAADIETRADRRMAQRKRSPQASSISSGLSQTPNKPLQRDWLLEVTAQAFDRAIDLRITRRAAR